MELMQELFFTISLAIILSFLVAKLVSKAMSMSGDSGLSKSSNDHISADDSELLFKAGGERLAVQASQSETKVDVSTSESVRQVDRFRFRFQSQLEHPFQVGSSVEIEHVVKDITVEEAGQPNFPEVTPTDDGFGQQFDVVELAEKSSEQTPETDDVISFRDQKEECDIDDAVEQKSEDSKVSRIDVSVTLSNEKQMVVQSEDICRVDAGSESREIVEQKKGSEEQDDDDDDDWEGIERTELEKVFAAATKFVGGDETRSTDERLSKISTDVQIKMYGLEKIATEGPCREPQPMPLKTSARAKWNAWRELGNMNPEDAMEQYISLLSDKIPEWMEETSMRHVEPESIKREPEVLSSASADLRPSVYQRPVVEDHRNPGLEAGVKQGDHGTD